MTKLMIALGLAAATFGAAAAEARPHHGGYHRHHRYHHHGHRPHRPHGYHHR